jgi:MOSC domain-containing protein YiiM
MKALFLLYWAKPARNQSENQAMQIEQLYLGKLTHWEAKNQNTGIFKQPVDCAYVSKEGLVGDVQADRRFHGGPEKALHQFAQASYDKIVEGYPELNGIAVKGTIGENFSCADMTDENVFIGDIYQYGTAVIQVAQPRNPCWKINYRYKVELLSNYIAEHAISGWYYRVLQEGKVAVGDTMVLLERPNHLISNAGLLHLMNQQQPALLALEAARDCAGLNTDWIKRIDSRIKHLTHALNKQ